MSVAILADVEVKDPDISLPICIEEEINAGLFCISAKSVLIPAIAAAKEAEVFVKDPDMS